MPDSNIPFLEVKLAGTINITSSVRSVSVEDNDRLIDRATIVLDDPHGATANVPRENLPVRVTMGWGDERAVLFEGLVVRAPAAAGAPGGSTVTVVALDPSYQMMQANADSPDQAVHNPKTRDLPPGKLSAILQGIVSHYGVPVGIIKCDPDPEFTQHAPLRQVNQTDWEFIQDLALAYSARAYVEYNEGAARFYFQPESLLLQGDPMGKLTYCPGFSGLIRFEYQRAASSAAAQRTAVTTDPASGAPVTEPPPAVPPAESPPAADAGTSATLARDNPAEAAQLEQGLQAAAAAPATPAAQRPAAPVVGSPSDPHLPGRVVRRDPTRILGFQGNGTAIGTVKLRAKGKVTIDGIATWATGDWYVHKAIHVYNRVIDNERDPRTNQMRERNHSTYYTRFVVTG